MPAEKSTVSKASENRRSNKPLMEKRRRARINQSLTELKSLILDAVKKDSSRHNKLEKADILEMTVKYLQNLQRQQLAANIVADPNVANKYRAGFGECANEVSRFLEKSDNTETNVRTRLLGHLTTCLTGLEKNPSTPLTVPQSSSTEPTPSTSPCPSINTEAPSSPMSSTATPSSNVDVNNNSSNTTKSNNAPALDTVFSGLQLIPTRLANGEIAFILPTHHALAAAQALNLGRLEQQLSPRPASSPAPVAQVSPMSRTTEDTKAEESVPSKAVDDTDHTSSSSDKSDISRSSPPPEPEQERSKTPSIVKDIGLIDEPVWRPW